MKTLYEIVGVNKVGDRVQLNLKPYEIAKKELSAQEIIANPNGLIEQMKLDAIRNRDPDAITVPVEEWEKYKWNIGDTVNVEILPEEVAKISVC